MIDDTTMLRAQLLDDLPSPYDGELESILTLGRRSRVRRRVAMVGCAVASIAVAAGGAGLALSAMRTPTHHNIAAQSQDPCAPYACVPGAMGIAMPDPTTGRPFRTAAAASAAGGGFYVPDCPGHSTYYLQPGGGVATYFRDRAALLSISPPNSGYIFGPIQGNSVVTPQQLTAQGQVAYGYEATPQIVTVSPGRQEGVLVHSFLVWVNHGSEMRLSSATKLSLAQLQHIADSCK